MPACQPIPIGVNLRVTVHNNQGGRKYMEDYLSVAYQSADDSNVEYAYFGVYDGHGGTEAANFARENLMETIVKQKLFWSENDDDVTRAIREGYIATHHAMWREQDKWPKTATGLPSTAGTTATIAFVRRGKLYIGHVGDSGLILGYQEDGEEYWRAMRLTQDHKPECNTEKSRIMKSGGKVINKSGVPRVVWNRPRLGHKGPVTRSTPFDEIPFLAVARSLGDLWSYNSALNEFVVSPDPDVEVLTIDPKKFRCLIFGTDGLWNVFSAKQAVEHVQNAEEENQVATWKWINPSKFLVDNALRKWNSTKMRADNITVVTILIYPPGPPSAQTMRQHEMNMQCAGSGSGVGDVAEGAEHVHHSKSADGFEHFTTEPSTSSAMATEEEFPYHPTSSIALMTRPDRSTTNDLGYMNSFAESYNSLYEHSHEVSQAEQQQLQKLPHFRAEYSYHHYHHHHHHYYHHHNSDEAETYSLTKLQTRSEQIRSESETEMTIEPQHSGLEDVGGSEDPHNLSLEFHNYYAKDTLDAEYQNVAPPADSEYSARELYESNVVTVASAADNEEPLDDSIQINEISSSSSSASFVHPTHDSVAPIHATDTSTTTKTRESSTHEQRIIVTRSKPIKLSCGQSTRSKSTLNQIKATRQLRRVVVHPKISATKLTRRISQRVGQNQRLSLPIIPIRIITKSASSSLSSARQIHEVRLSKLRVPTIPSKSRICKTKTITTTPWPSITPTNTINAKQKKRNKLSTN